LHYSLSKKQITGLTREEHRKMFEGNIHIEREKLKSRNTGFDLKTHFSNSKKDLKIKREIKEVLKKLSKEYMIGIVTSVREYGVYDYLKANGIESLFSFVYGFETSKIKVDKFKKVFSEYGLRAEDCIFVSDTLGDILEAREVGVRTIAVDFGYHEKERLQKGEPFKVISNIEDLIPVVENI
jgi:phosphoglycolate phosphatase